MSVSARTDTQTVSLPKGGGALQGLGEKFSPELHTGTGSLVVPIPVPHGRNGFTPDLRLLYSTGTGNGPFGLGWQLSTRGLTRRTAKGVPSYDAGDVFILTGSEELVRIEELQDGVTSYRPRTETTFARILHRQTGDHDYWEVKEPNGLTSFFGTPGAETLNGATIADPNAPTRIFAWKLTRTLDPFGNRIEFVYDKDASAEDGPHRWDQSYLSEVRYVDFGDPADPSFLVTVRFDYEARPDPWSDYRAGFEVRTIRRCTAVRVFTHATGSEPLLVRTLQLTYLDPAQGPANGVSLLARIEMIGHDGAADQRFAPLEFHYTRFEPANQRFFAVSGPDLPPLSLAAPDYDIADLNGNGLPDIIEMNGAVRYWRNRGGGVFDHPRQMEEAPSGLYLSENGVQLIDANGDGRSDLLMLEGTHAGYFPSTFAGGWDRRSFRAYQVAPSFELRDPVIRFVDLNGDSVTDAVRCGARLECFFNEGESGWRRTRWVERGDLEHFPDVPFDDPRVRWSDLSGDGLIDIVVIHDGSVEYWPASGHGSWGNRIAMRNSPRLPLGYNPKRILLGDIDGDGAADFVYVDSDCVTIWMNQCGNAWSNPIVLKGTPPVSDVDAVRLVDLLGCGTAGLLWTADADFSSRDRMFFLDLTGNVKPYLLNRIDNHVGATTLVQYGVSTTHCLRDENDDASRWRSPLPIAVPVVNRTEIVDHFSGNRLVSEFTYRDGYWDGADREFRGFGRVDRRDTEIAITSGGDQTSSAPPTEARTWFHQGALGDEFGEWEEAGLAPGYWPDDPPALTRPGATTLLLKTLPRRAARDAVRSLRGRILRTELYALDGSVFEPRPYTVAEYAYGVREESPPDESHRDRVRVFFPHLASERTTNWERGSEPMTRLQFCDDYDGFGRPQSTISIAVPRGRDYRDSAAAAEPYLVTQALTRYAGRDDAERFIVHRVALGQSFQILNDGSLPVPALVDAIHAGAAERVLIGQTTHYYDGEAFEGLPPGEIGDFGALARTEQLVLTPALVAQIFGAPPVYLNPSGPPEWSSEYPQEFRQLLPQLAGYIFRSATSFGAAEGYCAASEQIRYDFQTPNAGSRGLVLARRDALGNESTVRFDEFSLLPVETTDAAGFTHRAVNDYRVMQPREITDPNGNHQRCSYTPLGFVRDIANLGKPGDAADTLEVPGVRFEYDLQAFDERGQPISAHAFARVHHALDTSSGPPEHDRVVERIEFSDGFGRVLQTRVVLDDPAFGHPVFGGDLLQPQPSDADGAAFFALPSGAEARVLVSDWKIYDNKGRVVERYEPFFSSGLDYESPAAHQLGRKVRFDYDPCDRVVQTISPDGSEQRLVIGVPLDLANPDECEPSPWETYSYDANDNAGRTHPHSSSGFQLHWNTPSNRVMDALGRAVLVVQRNGPEPASEWLTTTSQYDIQGNVISVRDTLGRIVERNHHDLGGHALLTESLDGGARRSVLDAMSRLVESRDARGALLLYSYDALGRNLRGWARDTSSEPIALRQRVVYGGDPAANKSEAESAAANLLGKVYQTYDEAGLTTCEAYDFKGLLLEETRRLIADAAILSAFDAPSQDWTVQAFRTDWQPTSGTFEDRAAELLDALEYRSSFQYDALRRMTRCTFPVDVEASRRALNAEYNSLGILTSANVDGEPFIDRIACDSLGQRVLVAYGNGVMTRYAYDPATLRVARARSERFDQPATDPLGFVPVDAASPLRDVMYEHDLVGNILRTIERTPGCGVQNNVDAFEEPDPLLAQLLAAGDALIRRFTYDPLYRLLTATGRQCDSIPAPRPPADIATCGYDSGRHGTIDQDNAPSMTRVYREAYGYDPAGNLTVLRHTTADQQWTRRFGFGGFDAAAWEQQWLSRLGATDVWSDPPGNRLTHFDDGSPASPQTHVFDDCGALVREYSTRHFEWGCTGSLRVFKNQVAGAEPSVYAAYLYDSVGRRVKKVVRKQGGRVETTAYVSAGFEHHRIRQGAEVEENNLLHVMDGERRASLLRIGPVLLGDTGPARQFIVADHLGSASIVVDDAGVWVNREEFSPYGETLFGSFARKRFRFIGRERDEESGLGYHGARYYAPHLARWISCDPAGTKDGPNLYCYASCNPIRLVDPGGLQGEEADDSCGGGMCSEAGTSEPGVEPMQGGINTASMDATAGVEAPALEPMDDNMSPQYSQFGGSIYASPPPPPPPPPPPAPSPAEVSGAGGAPAAPAREGGQEGAPGDPLDVPAPPSETEQNVMLALTAAPLVILGAGYIAGAYAAAVAKAGGGALLANGSPAAAAAAAGAASPQGRQAMQLAQNYAAGRSFQQAATRALEMIENKAVNMGQSGIIFGETAAGRFRASIPDLFTRFAVVEIKNVKQLSLSPQLQSMIYGAKVGSQTFSLIVNETTAMSKPLVNEVLMTGGIIMRFNPAARTFSPF